MSPGYVWTCILIGALVTISLRALPFVLFGGKEGTPGLIGYLGRVLPYSVMALLVVYCLRDSDLTLASSWAPRLIASVFTCAVYVFKRNSLLSIALGTVCYMLLVQLVF